MAAALIHDDKTEEDKDSYAGERKQIRNAFALFDKDNKHVVDKLEIGTIMRYLGEYPTEEALVTEILPLLQDDEESQFVKLERFEPFMLKVLLDRTYEPDGYQEVEHAFRVLDMKGSGYLEEEELHKLLCKGNEWGFREEEWKEFLTAAGDGTDGRISYIDYLENVLFKSDRDLS